MCKMYSVQSNIGEARHVVNFYDGIKKHSDGSNFWDVRIFSNMRARDKFIAQLKAQGFTA